MEPEPFPTCGRGYLRTREEFYMAKENQSDDYAKLRLTETVSGAG
jgi:hypothetical protein